MAATEPPFVPTNPRGSVVAGRNGERTVVWLRGEHDMATSAELTQTLARAIAIDDADVVVDLSDVEFLDCSAIGIILRARDFLGPRSRSLTLRAPRRSARRVLDACGLAELIDPNPQRPEAAAALGTWVAVPSIDPARNREDESAPTGPGDEEQAGEAVTLVAARRGT